MARLTPGLYWLFQVGFLVWQSNKVTNTEQIVFKTLLFEQWQVQTWSHSTTEVSLYWPLSPVSHWLRTGGVGRVPRQRCSSWLWEARPAREDWEEAVRTPDASVSSLWWVFLLGSGRLQSFSSKASKSAHPCTWHSSSLFLNGLYGRTWDFYFERIYRMALKYIKFCGNPWKLNGPYNQWCWAQPRNCRPGRLEEPGMGLGTQVL